MDYEIVYDAYTGRTVSVPLTPENIAERKAWEAGAYDREFAAVEEARLQGYQKTADPIMAQWLRGEKTEQEWLDAVQAVKDANPYPAKKK